MEIIDVDIQELEEDLLREFLGEKEKEPVLGMKFLLILHCYCLMNQLQAWTPPLQIDSFRSSKVLQRYKILDLIDPA